MIFGNKFTRKELEVMTLNNTTNIEELTERLHALETYLGIEYKGGEYIKIKKTAKKLLLSAKTPKIAKTAKGTKTTKTKKV